MAFSQGDHATGLMAQLAPLERTSFFYTNEMRQVKTCERTSVSEITLNDFGGQRQQNYIQPNDKLWKLEAGS